MTRAGPTGVAPVPLAEGRCDDGGDVFIARRHAVDPREGGRPG